MKIIAQSFKMIGDLDDDFTLYDNGQILHEYDIHKYPGGYNLKRTLNIQDIDNEIKLRLFNAASQENKELVREILGL